MNMMDDAIGMTGLQALRALIDAGQQAPIANTLGLSLTQIDAGYARFESRHDLRAYNPIGSIHGGYAATLLDSACGCALHSMPDAGLSANSGLVRAEGRVISLGRRVGFTEATLTDEKGRICATATLTLLVIPPPATAVAGH